MQYTHYNIKNPAAIIKYTATYWAPSSQFDSPSPATLLAINTVTINAINSNWLNIIVIGVNNKLKNTRIGATNNIICKLEPIAISIATSILFFSAIEIAVVCSAALPIIGIKIIPTKVSLKPSFVVIPSTPSTKNSLSIAINIVDTTKITIAFVKDHFAFSSSFSYLTA